MDTILLNGDFKRNEKGKPYLENGIEEVIQRCKIILTVEKGSFVYNRALGSNIRSVLKSNEAMDLAVKEILLAVPQVNVESVSIDKPSSDYILKVKITAHNEEGEFEVIL